MGGGLGLKENVTSRVYHIANNWLLARKKTKCDFSIYLLYTRFMVSTANKSFNLGHVKIR